MRRVTITIPDETYERVRGAVAQGESPSVSAFLSAVADVRTRELELLRVVDDLDEALGAPEAQDVAWARSVVGR